MISPYQSLPSHFRSLLSKSVLFGFSALCCLYLQPLELRAAESKAVSLKRTAVSSEERPIKIGDKIVESRDLWKYSVPRKAISANQLPVGKLTGLLRKRKIAEIRHLLKETPVHPGDASERFMWEAACLSSLNRSEQAVLLFDKVKNLDTAPVLVQVKAAEAYASDAQYDKAIKLCNKVLAKYEVSEAYQIRAGCYGATNRLTEAAGDFEKLAILGGRSPIRFYCRAASLLLKAGKSKEALAMVDRGLNVTSGESTAPLYMVKGDCFKSQGQWQDAVNSVSEAIRLTRSHKASAGGEDEVILSTCYKERAFCYQKLGQLNLAKSDLKALEESSRGLADEIIGNH